MSNELVTVATFNFTTDPNFLLFKAALEHHQIPYLAAEEHTVNANPFLSISVGGIRVQVHEDDIPTAIGIWREISEGAEQAVLSVETDFGEQDTVLDDMRSRTVLSLNDPNSASHSTYFLLVLALAGLLIAVLLLITFLSL